MRYFSSLGYGILSGGMLLFPFFGGKFFEWIYFLTGYFLCGYLIFISGYLLILILHLRFRYGYVAGAGLEGELFLNWEKPYPGDYESEILGPWSANTPGIVQNT